MAPSFAPTQTLTTLGKEFAALVHPEIVAKEAGDLLLTRHEYRVAVREGLVERSSGGARAYLRAFEDVDHLLTMVASFMARMIMKVRFLRSSHAEWPSLGAETFATCIRRS